MNNDKLLSDVMDVFDKAEDTTKLQKKLAEAHLSNKFLREGNTNKRNRINVLEKELGNNECRIEMRNKIRQLELELACLQQRLIDSERKSAFSEYISDRNYETAKGLEEELRTRSKTTCECSEKIFEIKNILKGT